MLKVKVSGDNPDDPALYLVECNESQMTLDGAVFAGDIAQLSEKSFHIIWNDKSYNVEILGFDKTSKTVKMRINGFLMAVEVKDKFDILLEEMGVSNSKNGKINRIKAPMPGLIQSVMVKPGDAVIQGDSLIVLVAMKMENIIKSSGDGIVKSIQVSEGEIVEKNQVILEFL